MGQLWHRPTQAGERLRGLRRLLFLRDVAFLACTCVGGPHAHLAMFQRLLVDKRKWLGTEDLLELNALCQLLPGPTSTQTLTAVAFRLGGPTLAYLALAIWLLPSVAGMTLLAVAMTYVEARQISLGFTRFVQPVAVGLVAHSAVTFAQRSVYNNLHAALLIGALGVTYLFPSPYVAPVLLLVGGLLTAVRYRSAQEAQAHHPMQIEWANFLLWIGVFVAAALAGRLTQSLPIRLFENFYRNGSLIFGGGQVLLPLIYNEFVVFKKYLNSQEFLLGYAVAQGLPGPVFAYCAYVGGMAGRRLGWGVAGTCLGAGMATLGIFLPGTFLIFFIIRFWAQLKQFRVVRASLEGINAVSAGLVFAAGLLLFKPIEATQINVGVIGLTFALMQFTKAAPWMLILSALALGLAWPG